MRLPPTGCSTARDRRRAARAAARPPEIEQRTRELVAAESKCCAFLDFELGRENGYLVLDIAGPEDARPVIDMFFAPEAA